MPKKPKLVVAIGMGRNKDSENEGAFDAPEGMEIEGKKPGDTMEAVCELRIEEGGKLCVTKVNGMEVPGYEDEDDTGKAQKMGPGEKDSYKGGFADAVMPPKEDDLQEGARG